MTKKKNGLLSAALIYIIGSFFTQGLRFLTLPIFSRIMPTDDFGYLASYETWVAIIMVVIGLQTTSSIANAYIDYGEKNIEDYVYSISYIGSITALITTIVLSIFASGFTRLFEVTKFSLYLGIVQCLFTFFFTALITEYRMLNKPWKYLFFTVGNSVVTLSLAIVFVLWLPSDKYIGRVYGLTIAAFIFGLIAIVIVFLRTKTKKPQFDHIKYALKLSVPLIFHAFAAIVLSRCDQIMLLKLTTASDAGIYSYGTNFAHIIYVLYTACNQAYLPWYYKKLNQKQEKEILAVNRLYIFLFSIGFIAFIFILPEIIKIMSAKEYYGAMYSAPIVSFGFYLNYLYNFPVNYEFFHKKTHFIALGTILSAGINIALNALLIPILGAIGAAFATAGSYLILLIAHVFVAKKIIKNYSMPIRYFTITFLAVSAMISLYYVTINLLIIRLIVFIVCGVSALLLIMKNKNKIKEIGL